MSSFSNLKKLTQGKNNIYLILVIWTLIGFTVNEFLPPLVSVIIFLPLMAICLIFFFASLFTRKTVDQFSNKRIFLHVIITLPFIIILFYIGIYLFYVSFISYIFLTAFFTMYTCYKTGVKIYDGTNKLPRGVKEFSQWSIFLGGTVISIAIIYGTAFVLHNLLGYTIDETTFNPYGIAWILIISIIILAVVTGILNLRGAFNSWIGVFFLGVAVYAGYQMYSITSALQPDDGSGYAMAITVVIFIGNLILILNSFGNLLGEQSELLASKLRIFKWDTILLWLMFSTASFRFAEALPNMEASLFKNIAVFILFVPLMIFLAFYGMNYYMKLHKNEKANALKPTPESVE